MPMRRPTKRDYLSGKRRALPLVLLLCAALFGKATAHIEWETEKYDFGTIAESDGPKSGEVKFVNKGPDAASIIKVTTSCGCTIADYESDPILPGESSSIRFTYNPAGRPGMFEKKLRVFVDSISPHPVIIRLTGKVIGSAETLGLNYPSVHGDLRLSADSVDMGAVRPGKSRHTVITIYNQGTDTIVPEIRDLPDGVDANVTPGIIIPGDQSFLGIFINIPYKQKTTGEWNREIKLTVPDKNLEIPIRLRLNILSDKKGSDRQ